MIASSSRLAVSISRAAHVSPCCLPSSSYSSFSAPSPSSSRHFSASPRPHAKVQVTLNKGSKFPTPASRSDPALEALKATPEASHLPPLVVGDFAPNRLKDYYDNVLKEDLMYMSYRHSTYIKPPFQPQKIRSFDARPWDKFTLNQVLPQKLELPVFKVDQAFNIPEIKYIHLSMHVKDVTTSKSNMVVALHLLRSITGGDTTHKLGRQRSRGIYIGRAKEGNHNTQVRKGMPFQAHSTLSNPFDCHNFIQTLTEFVLPRMKDFVGFTSKGLFSDYGKPHQFSRSFEFTIPSHDLALFPSIESSGDTYPHMYPLNVKIHTNVLGPRAAHLNRALMSGFRMPVKAPKPQVVGQESQLVLTPEEEKEIMIARNIAAASAKANDGSKKKKK